MSDIRLAVKLLAMACIEEGCDKCPYHTGEYCNLSLTNAGCPCDWHTENDSLEAEND